MHVCFRTCATQRSTPLCSLHRCLTCVAEREFEPIKWKAAVGASAAGFAPLANLARVIMWHLSAPDVCALLSTCQLLNNFDGNRTWKRLVRRDLPDVFALKVKVLFCWLAVVMLSRVILRRTKSPRRFQNRGGRAMW
jgi:hypothetical protein